MIFSDRMQLVDKLPMTTDSITSLQKNDIFNFIIDNIFSDDVLNDYVYGNDIIDKRIITDILTKLFHVSMTRLSSSSHKNLEKLKTILDNTDWYYTYDLLEYSLQISQPYVASSIYKDANNMLASSNLGYRFVKKELVPIVSKIDQRNIEKSVNKKFDDGHLSTGLKELSKRKNPNYNIVAKEAIDAVEIVVKKIACELFNAKPNKTLGQYVKLLSENGFIENHQAYLTALSNLYGYSSDGGIRHPDDTRDYKIDKTDATFMLEICSAFVSMLFTKYTEYDHTESTK